MNWVGGVRKRVRNKEEKRIQKEYFEKKRFMSQLNRVSDDSPSKKREGLSQDLLSIHTINHIHKTTQGKSSQENLKKINHIDLEKVFDPFFNYRKRERNLELPMSPIETISKLELQDHLVPRLSEQKHNCSNDASESNTPMESFFRRSQFQGIRSTYNDAANKENLRHVPLSQPAPRDTSTIGNQLDKGQHIQQKQEPTMNPQLYQKPTSLGEQVIDNETSKSFASVSPFSSSLLPQSNSPYIHLTSTPYSMLAINDNSQVVPNTFNYDIQMMSNARKMDCKLTSRNHVYHNTSRTNSSDLVKDISESMRTDNKKFHYESNLSMIINQTHNHASSVGSPCTFVQHYAQTEAKPTTHTATYMEGNPRQKYVLTHTATYPKVTGLDYQQRYQSALAPFIKRGMNSPNWKQHNIDSTADNNTASSWMSFIRDSDGQINSPQSIDIGLDRRKSKMSNISEEVLREVLSLDEELMNLGTTQQVDDAALEKDFSNLSDGHLSNAKDSYQACFIDNNWSQASKNLQANESEEIGATVTEVLCTPNVNLGHPSASDDGVMGPSTSDDGGMGPSASDDNINTIPQEQEMKERIVGLPQPTCDCSIQTTGGHCSTCKCFNSPGVSCVVNVHKVETLRPKLSSSRDTEENQASDNQLKINKVCDNTNNTENCQGFKQKQIEENKENGLLETQSKDEKCPLRYSLRPRNLNK